MLEFDVDLVYPAFPILQINPRLSPFPPSPRGMLGRRLLQTFLEKGLELRTDLPGLALEFVQKLALLVVNLSISEQHLPQPGGLLGVDFAVREDVAFDRLLKELLEPRRAALHALV